MNRICLTMGDPAGVGPELLIRLLDRLDPKTSPDLLLIGDERILKFASQQFAGKRANTWFQNARILNPGEISGLGRFNLLSLSNLSPQKIPGERGSKKHGKAMWRYIESGARLCHKKTCAGMVTLPVNKEAMLKAGCPYPGHTDLLAHLDGDAQAVMMMALGKLRVGLLTHHIPLREVPKQIEPGKILSILKIMDRALAKDFGITKPEIAVLGLNPHSGETGRIGDEEIRMISPAIRRARNLGINAFGPIPGDTAFARHQAGEFDALLALYHDQGIAPIKALGFERVVNVTLGLSFVRTSPGHGTAYDLAWQGKADPTSLWESFQLARRLVRNREQNYA